MTWRRFAKQVATFALAVSVAGCAAHRGGGVTFHDAKMDFSLIQSVAVMPFVNLTPQPNAAERTRDVFMTMLQATGSVYVLPPGEVGRGVSRANLPNPSTPTAEEAVAFCKNVKADVVITGTVREYGEVRSGTASANVISISVKMMEAQTGTVVWSSSSARGGISFADRLFGTGGEPMDEVTERAVENLLSELFK